MLLDRQLVQLVAGAAVDAAQRRPAALDQEEQQPERHRHEQERRAGEQRTRAEARVGGARRGWARGGHTGTVASGVATTQVIRSQRFPDLDDEVLFPRISDAKLAWLAERGEHLTFLPGEALYEHAVRDAPFYVIDRGLVEFIDRKPGKDVYVAQADSRTFIGDIAIFTGEPTISACVAVEPTDVIAFDRRRCARWWRAGPSSASTSSAR